MRTSFAVGCLILLFILIGCSSESDTDESNAAGRIEVTFPEAYEWLDVGVTYTLRWESRDMTGQVRISLVDISRDYAELVADSVVDDGAFNEFTPDSVCYGCRVRIESVDQPSVYDESGQFSIVYPWNVTYSQENALYGIDYAEAGDGIGFLVACGGAGKIIVGRDYSTPYNEVEIETDADLYAIDVLSMTSAFVVGDGGVIYHAASSLYSWQPQVSGVTVPLRSVYFADDGLTGYVVGGALGVGGVLLRTNNGGETWTGSVLSLRAAALCVHGDSTVVWIGQEDGVLWKLQDGIATTDSTDLGAITDVAADWEYGLFGSSPVAPAVYAMNEAGVIRRYIDFPSGGAWDIITEETSVHANWGKLFATESYCWAAGPGQVMRSGSASASSWRPAMLDPSIGDAWVMDITGWPEYREGRWYLWAVTDGGAIMTAYNGAGRFW